MKLTVSLSVSWLVKAILAHSAAECEWTGEEKPLLTSENEAMLRIFIDEEIARTVLELSGIVEELKQDDSGDLRVLECELSPTTSLLGFRRNVETAVCAGVMIRVADEDSRDTYAHDRKGLIAALLQEAMTLPGTIARGA